jgi:hypothetical protein
MYLWQITGDCEAVPETEAGLNEKAKKAKKKGKQAKYISM